MERKDSTNNFKQIVKWLKTLLIHIINKFNMNYIKN